MIYKTFRFIGVFIFIIVVIMIIRGFNTSPEIIHEKHLKLIKEKQYKGIVSKKYIDKKNHTRNFLVLDNKINISINSDAYNEIEIKDSISKIKGNLFLTVFRNHSLQKIDLQ